MKLPVNDWREIRLCRVASAASALSLNSKPLYRRIPKPGVQGEAEAELLVWHHPRAVHAEVAASVHGRAVEVQIHATCRQRCVLGLHPVRQRNHCDRKRHE